MRFLPQSEKHNKPELWDARDGGWPRGCQQQGAAAHRSRQLRLLPPGVFYTYSLGSFRVRRDTVAQVRGRQIRLGQRSILIYCSPFYSASHHP